MWNFRLCLVAALLISLSSSARVVRQETAQDTCWSVWRAETIYTAGATVSYQSVNYRAAWWTQGDAPACNSAVDQPWVRVASCSVTPSSTSAPTTQAPAQTPTQSPSTGNATCKGTPLHIATDIDVCLPAVVCTAETCPPSLGQCVDGACQYKAGYQGLLTTPEAWSTYYCTLSTGGCHGITQVEFPEVTAEKIATSMNMPLCESLNSGDTKVCIGIAASSPMIVGNSQIASDPATGGFVANWGMGLTEASGLCYSVTGPGGTAIVALTDRCGGYCKCGGSGYQECGPCVSAEDMQPNCACVGSVDGQECCGMGCSTTKQDCDWCASNNHPHFDLDIGTFAHVCGDIAAMGSCRLTKVSYVPCMTPLAWPPGAASGGANASPTCPANQFVCNGVSPAPEQPVVPDTQCCCAWGMHPQPDGTCQ